MHDLQRIWEAGVSLALSFPGNPQCAVGAYTNALTWHGSTLGQASWPTTFNISTKEWSYTLTYFNDQDALGGAGCYFYPYRMPEIGPAVFNEGNTIIVVPTVTRSAKPAT